MSAAQFYERAVQLEPFSAAARVNLGAAYLASARYEDAELVYELLIRENPEDAEAYFNLGWALLSQGRRDEARSAWQQALALDYEPAGRALEDYF
jgi:tetratricopeptide (TPR) repeat protein